MYVAASVRRRLRGRGVATPSDSRMTIGWVMTVPFRNADCRADIGGTARRNRLRAVATPDPISEISRRDSLGDAQALDPSGDQPKTPPKCSNVPPHIVNLCKERKGDYSGF